MLLNEPTPHPTRPAATTAAAAAAGIRELPPVELDGAAPPPRVDAEADTVAFVAVDGGGEGGASNGAGASGGTSVTHEAEASDERLDRDAHEGDGASADSVASDDASDGPVAASDGEAAPADGARGGESAGSDAISTIALDVEAVKRAVAEGLSAPDATATVSLDVEAVKQAVTHAPTVPLEPETDSLEPTDTAATDTDSHSATDSATDTDTSAELVPSAESAVAEPAAPAAYLVSTDLSTPTSSVVAVPETADDVIATIHAAATAVAAADLRARRAAVVKEDPWTGLDLHRPAAPAPVDNVLDLLAPVLERPLLVVEQPGLPDAADVVALHRSELEVDFVEPPVLAAGAEPPIPPRYGPGLSVLPHIEFPV